LIKLGPICYILDCLDTIFYKHDVPTNNIKAKHTGVLAVTQRASSLTWPTLLCYSNTMCMNILWWKQINIHK